MRRIGRYILTICAAVLLCGCYNSARLPDGKESELSPNKTLSELRGYWQGSTFEVGEEVVVGGVVTSSDEAGNFYRTLTIEDATGAAEIMAGVRDLHNGYPVGCSLCVRLKGCAVGIERGVMQIGLKPASYSNYAVDYFYSKVLLDRYIERSGEVSEVTPAILGFENLSLENCGRLVEIKALRLVVGMEDTADTESSLPVEWRGYRLFEDGAGNRLYTYTSDYANFAAKVVPTEPCDITGVLQYGAVEGEPGEWFILKMRNEDDCKQSSDTAR